ncbi:alpha/beta hydrolase [Actinomycetospora termitidis]|uniref:Alpha/beta hydrolase n=1 Tax=Actinomycetospora termitidis TaxID=3053470 RepID=A0ABT7M555_9PSEU|nr:alpha/beta hydrolase [Actinomycetospora sp. Odt1-22]MDL5155794.1 alpha/beta hydrolase [Actinomycetospora sp. Odt1-22]
MTGPTTQPFTLPDAQPTPPRSPSRPGLGRLRPAREDRDVSGHDAAVDIDVRTRLFTWFTDRAGVIAISRMDPAALARARSRRLTHNVVTSRVFGPMPADVSLTDLRVDLRQVGGTDPDPTTLRLYRPHGALPGGRRREDGLPIVVNYHGGGGSLGNLDQSDWLCAQVAARIGALVLSVDYRLAPEHPYPAGRDDGYAALVWAVRHAEALGGRADRVAVMGDSAGGNLAAVVAMMARESGPGIDAQVLIYPVVDLTLDAPSTAAFERGPLLTKADMDVFCANYLGPDGDATDPLCSPLLAPDHRGLPRALVITAKVDPLHDDGVAYAHRLRAAGVPTRHSDHARAVHGFMTFPGMCRAATAALDEICDELGGAFGPAQEDMKSPPLTE